MKFPAAPLLAVWERTAVAKGYVGVSSQVGKQGGSEGFAAFCAVIGIHENTYYRAKRTGWLSIRMADEVTCALGLHPILIWPAEYNRWLDVLTIAEMEDLEHYERQRDLQRYHQRARGAA